MPVTRGFTGNRRPERPDRLPPGQYDTGTDWPTLTAEATPDIPPEEWTITVDGLVERPHTWTWREAHALPGSTYFGDIHCVTSWSKLDTTFGGVSVDELLAIGSTEGAAALGLDSWAEIEADVAHPSLEGVEEGDVRAALLFGASAEVFA